MGRWGPREGGARCLELPCLWTPSPYPDPLQVRFPCLFPCAVTGYPLPQQHDPTINKSFLDPPLPRAPSGTLAAAAATDPFQKGGVAAARGSAARVLGLNRGGARPLSPGRRERCERAPGAHWPRRATLPGLDWAVARRGVASPALGPRQAKGEVRVDRKEVSGQRSEVGARSRSHSSGCTPLSQQFSLTAVFCDLAP
ncbi:Immunoglobulin Heavy Variable 3-13 [Manis pentadactyla]|nr:Immunoglobulin Heavy Variable 3-13 [Manis pentadactyla]